MKRFLINASFFAMIIVLMCAILEVLLLYTPNEYAYKCHYVEQQGDKIKVLILGHSHANHGIDPEVVGDSVFNMSIDGRNHYYDAEIAERYIPTLKNLRCIIYPLEYNVQYANYTYPCLQRENEESFKYKNSYKCMYEKYMGITPPHTLPYLYWSEIINSNLDYVNRLFRKNDESRISCTTLGYRELSVEHRKPQWKESKLPSIVDYDSKNAPLALAEGLNDFKRIAAACRDNKVRLVVVTTPCYYTYIGHVTKRGLTEMYACVDTMRSVYPAMEYYNFMTDNRFRDDKNFWDSSHLSEVGAKKFSTILRDEVLSQ